MRQQSGRWEHLRRGNACLNLIVARQSHRASPVRAGHIRLHPGLIDENQACRINLVLMLLPQLAPASDVRPILLAGVQCFFKAEARSVDDVPHREVAAPDTASRQFGQQCPQRQVGLLRQSRNNPLTLASQDEGTFTP